MKFILALVMLTAFCAAYWAPTIITLLRKRPNAGGIVALNALLGWTMIGWVFALVWALTNPSNPTVIYVERQQR
jgi:hypothetical protein